MKADYHSLFEFLEMLLSKAESIEIKLSTKTHEHKYKEYMNVNELLEYLKDNAIIISKSRLYRLTATSCGIPYRKIYNKLVFSKKEIDLWIEMQFTPQRSRNNTHKTKVSPKQNNKNNINININNYGTEKKNS
ncbi:MAG: helix-turn-helix domain-containing protein [Suipraeoptans sp.]